MPILKKPIGTPDAPQQLNQKSRKGKKAWRKNVDVSEIQSGLAAVQDEVRQGGVITEKPSEDLFMVDADGDDAIQRKYLRSSKPLKSDEIIAQRSAVPPVSMKKRMGDKTTDGVVEPKRQRVSYVSHKELTRLRNVLANHGQPASVEDTEATSDPWEAAATAPPPDPRFSFLPKPQGKKVAPTTLKQKPVSLAASGKPVPAVSRPNGGYSYNPVYTEYEERLVRAGEAELEAERKRLEAQEAERVRAEAAAKSAAEAEAAEARAELAEFEEESAWEGLESGAEDTAPAKKRPERKSVVQRNRIKRRKEEERKQKMAANEKKKREQAQHAKDIAQALQEREAARKLAVQEPKGKGEGEGEAEFEEDVDALELRRRKLGRINVPQKDLELPLPDELAESLRVLKPEGNALKDRYRSLLLRGKLEGRRPVNHTKKQKKLTEKWSYKDFMLH